ncbi:MAG: hypothetical protein QN173_11010 [Armatimonadota bacterium]|nr:hypothetical protein [Armatimonadota bacterium]MDR7401559.1 hypothetical protein [Armatimonadota bacterium]MDR7438204.1 hypothetical protein [Armatimonadota bacterium]MDR7471633.1 hypothetical protein [Armatimonadota bacterium]MDR7508122.1 hypothetical protein [Armatimonadota bacterium]
MTTTSSARPDRTGRGRQVCQRCGRPLPPLAVRHGDPFCSRVCAEETYGTRTRRGSSAPPGPAPSRGA